MSDHHYEKPWFEKYWQIFVIAFGIGFVTLLFSYAPGTAAGEDGHVSAGAAKYYQAPETPAAVKTE